MHANEIQLERNKIKCMNQEHNVCDNIICAALVQIHLGESNDVK